MKSFALVCVLTALFIGVGVGPTAAQDKAKKGPVLHALFNGMHSNPGPNLAAVIIAPLPANATLEIYSVTTVNKNQNPITVQYRAVQPDDEPNPEDPFDACRGPGDTIDELTRVVVPAFSSFHQAFPEGTEMPGQLFTVPGDVSEATAPWCLIAFVPNDGLAIDGNVFEGMITVRVKLPE